tara:strand:+ start:2440 stop:2688 length:249 start_codon:yes stop_codon:yes gene_type:complete
MALTIEERNTIKRVKQNVANCQFALNTLGQATKKTAQSCGEFSKIMKDSMEELDAILVDNEKEKKPNEPDADAIPGNESDTQ